MRLALAHAFAPLLAGCFLLGAPGYEGPVSDHFDGERFHNLGPEGEKGFLAFLRWRFAREPGAWPERIDAPPGPPPPERVGAGELRATMIGHSTLLLQMDGVNVLTDPIWSERASPVAWAGPKRVRPPGIRFEDLPPIDAVIVSHNHYDHLDLPTLRRLWDAHRPRVFVGLGNGALLAEEGIPSEEVDWWDERPLSDAVTLASVPAQHWSARGLFDRRRTLWTGYVLKGPGGPVYFAGCTGRGPHFAMIRERFGPVRLALLPIGAYKPRWFMKENHLSPREAAEAAHGLEARTAYGIHWGTFALGDDGEREPVEDLRAALAEMTNPGPSFTVLGFGEGRVPPPLAAP